MDELGDEDLIRKFDDEIYGIVNGKNVGKLDADQLDSLKNIVNRYETDVISISASKSKPIQIKQEDIDIVLEALPEGTSKDITWHEFQQKTTGTSNNTVKAEAYYQFTGKSKNPISIELEGMTSQDKGKIGEKVADRLMKEQGYNKLPSKVGANNGFDGVYVKTKDGMKLYDEDGFLNIDAIDDLVINESKFNTAQLGNAKCGDPVNMHKQMSKEWLDFNMERMMRGDGGDYVLKTAECINEYLQEGNSIKLTINRIELLDGGGANNVWIDYGVYIRK